MGNNKKCAVNILATLEKILDTALIVIVFEI